MHPALIFAGAIAVLLATHFTLRWPLPVGLLLASALASVLAGFWLPLRHFVEGGFGYLNFVLALFAGAFFGQALRLSGAADAVARVIDRGLGGNRWLVLAAAGAMLYLTGMFVGIAGIAVLSTGVFVAPMLARLGLAKEASAAYIALLATCGMIAPPLNVPAMAIADGVNMPYSGVAAPLLALSLPMALFSLVSFAWRKPPSPPADEAREAAASAAAAGFGALALILGFWALLRAFPLAVPDPSVPLVLVAGALAALPLLGRAQWRELSRAIFSGVPLLLAAILVTVGVAVQFMTLTGVRGWLVIEVMSIPPPWTYAALLGVPIFGGVLTSIGAANVLGVPFAFGFLQQNMILNVSGLSAIAALSEFVPPTAIAVALASYVVGGPSILAVIRASLLPLAAMAALAVSMLVFAARLDPWFS